MITIKLRLTQPLASDLVYGISKSPYGTTASIDNAGEDSIEVALSHTKLDWIIQDCFVAGIYAGLNRMREPLNQEI